MLPPEHPERKPLRLKEYDYSLQGAYYVTICAHNRECLFGEVLNGEMVLNAAGRMVQQVWEELPGHYPHVALDAFVVMPNHVHFILFVGAIRESPANKPYRAIRESPLQTQRSFLSKCIGRLKMQTGKSINQHRQTPGTPVWQRGYYDHIIRNDADLFRIRHYILDNPKQWEQDAENLAEMAGFGV